ncbi:L,D-transpeptidase family protein [Clostridium sp. DL1XJH146]
MNHFYFGTTINCISVSGKKVEAVNELMEDELDKYELKLNERGGIQEVIKGNEIGLCYETGREFRDTKDEQSPYKWVSSIFNTEDSKMIEEVKFDNELLNKQINSLSCFDSSNVIEPQNPCFEYVDESYEIIAEVNGNKVNKEVLYSYVEDALLKRQSSIDLEEIDSYVKPEYTSNSQKIIDTRDLLNKYVSSKITYNFGSDNVVLDGNTINTWLSVDDTMEVKLDEQEVKNYIDELANNYNTIGSKRNFATSSGSTIQVSGGDYGWSVDRAEETVALIESIKAGEIVTKETAFSQRAMCLGKNDIGNTYVEINLSNQHLWFYKNGLLIADGPVVTGNISANHGTPSGIYRLKYKQKDAVLRGDDYEAPVAFWMPFNGGIGMHDANWRGSFGGSIYRTNGSHGCVNCPYYLAKAIFNNIDAGTPIICYK